METRNLICIGCPLGCPVTVTMDGDDINVTGNTCPRGADYAKKEVLKPYQDRDLQHPGQRRRYSQSVCEDQR